MVGDDDDDVSQRRAEEGGSPSCRRQNAKIPTRGGNRRRRREVVDAQAELRHPQCQRDVSGLRMACCTSLCAMQRRIFPIPHCRARQEAGHRLHHCRLYTETLPDVPRTRGEAVQDNRAS